MCQSMEASQHPEEGDILVISLRQMRKLKPRELKQLAQENTAGKWQKRGTGTQAFWLRAHFTATCEQARKERRTKYEKVQNSRRKGESSWNGMSVRQQNEASVQKPSMTGILRAKPRTNSN